MSGLVSFNKPASASGSSTTPVIPATDVIYKCEYLENSSNSKEMDIDGSTTTVDYFFEPGAGETWYIDSITMLIQDPGSMDVLDFGAISSGLTNGTQVIYKRSSTENVITNMQDNGDIAMCFRGQIVSTGGDGGAGFLDDVDTYLATMKLDIPIKLVGDDNDRILFRIRDDVTTLSFFRAAVLLWKAT